MTDTKSDKSTSFNGSRFSLIELLSIIILVGLVFVFAVPVNQAKLNRVRVADAVQTINFIGEKAEQFKDNPDNGYYPVDLSQLNLGNQIESKYFKYTIVSDDSTIVAETTQDYGKKGAFLIYNLSSKQYSIGKGESDNTSQKYINENWLP